MLKKIKKKTITLEEIKDLYKKYNYEDVVLLINELLDKNKIEPIKNSAITPYNPPLYTKYRIKKETVMDEESLLEELNQLHFKLSSSFYKKNLNLYKKDRTYIQELNNYLFISSNSLKNKISVNERSYEIFKDEKFLMSDNGKDIIKRLGISLSSFFNVYMTPEPFCYVSVNRKCEQNILIVENKDTYVGLIKLFNKGIKTIMGRNIDTIIYGEGYKIISSFEYINEDITLDYLNDKNNKILYWGDIDREGFIIYNTFKNKYNMMNISLFEEAYRLMVLKSKEFELTNIKHNQKQEYKIGLEELPLDLKSEICSIIDNNQYIPQEILPVCMLTKE